MESKHKPIRCFSQRPASQASLGSGLNPHMATSHCITTSLCLFKRPCHWILGPTSIIQDTLSCHICKDPISYLRSHLRRNRLDPVGASSQLYTPHPSSSSVEPHAHRHAQRCALPAFKPGLYASWTRRLNISSQEQHKKPEKLSTVKSSLRDRVTKCNIKISTIKNKNDYIKKQCKEDPDFSSQYHVNISSLTVRTVTHYCSMLLVQETGCGPHGNALF